MPESFTCPTCDQVLLVVMDPTDPELNAEVETKVDAHQCATVREGHS